MEDSDDDDNSGDSKEVRNKGVEREGRVDFKPTFMMRKPQNL